MSIAVLNMTPGKAVILRAESSVLLSASELIITQENNKRNITLKAIHLTPISVNNAGSNTSQCKRTGMISAVESVLMRTREIG